MQRTRSNTNGRGCAWLYIFMAWLDRGVLNVTDVFPRTIKALDAGEGQQSRLKQFTSPCAEGLAGIEGAGRVGLEQVRCQIAFAERNGKTTGSGGGQRAPHQLPVEERRSLLQRK